MDRRLITITHCGEELKNLNFGRTVVPLWKMDEELTKARKGKKKGNIEALVRWAGKVGFYGAKEKLEGKKGIKTPEKLAGWLKGQAKKKGVLSPEHPYVGRKKKKKVKKSLVDDSVKIPCVPERLFNLVQWKR